MVRKYTPFDEEAQAMFLLEVRSEIMSANAPKNGTSRDYQITCAIRVTDH